jgi:hemerythrin superfamily protein
LPTSSTTRAKTQNGALPARGGDAVEILIADHEVIKKLLDQLVDATTPARRKSTLEQLKGVLTIHNATEENLVYPALAVIAHRKMQSHHLYHETADADVLVFKIDQALQSAEDVDFQKLAFEFRDAVLEHIEDEENSAFPKLQEHAEPAEMKSLTKNVRDFRGKIHVDGAKL